MKFSLLLTLWLVICGHMSVAQSKAEKSKEKKADYSNSFEPFTPEKSATTSSKKKIKKKKQVSFKQAYVKSLEDKKEDFHKLMIANAKERKKIEKKSQKPKYSDPSFFGHKKKPKKRSLKKRKLCKECGIVH